MLVAVHDHHHTFQIAFKVRRGGGDEQWRVLRRSKTPVDQLVTAPRMGYEPDASGSMKPDSCRVSSNLRHSFQGS